MPWTCWIIKELTWGISWDPLKYVITNVIRISVHMYFRYIAAYAMSCWLEFNSSTSKVHHSFMLVLIIKLLLCLMVSSIFVKEL
jgi:hypothetical protein